MTDTPLQCNSAKIILILKELLAEHGVLESLKSDGSLLFDSTIFGEFADTQYTNHLMTPHIPHVNEFAESAGKVIKGLLT